MVGIGAEVGGERLATLSSSMVAARSAASREEIEELVRGPSDFEPAPLTVFDYERCGL
jgi:hypothetical protein